MVNEVVSRTSVHDNRVSVNHVVSGKDNHAHVIIKSVCIHERVSPIIMLVVGSINSFLENTEDLNHEKTRVQENVSFHILVISTHSSVPSNHTSEMRISAQEFVSG